MLIPVTQVSSAGAVLTYTPVWTGSGSNPAIGDGTLTGRYVLIGKLVSVWIAMTAGGSTTFGAGTWSFSLPVTGQAAFFTGTAYADNFGVAAYPVLPRMDTASTIALYLNGSPLAAVTASVPFSWGATDFVKASIVYEAA